MFDVIMILIYLQLQDDMKKKKETFSIFFEDKNDEFKNHNLTQH